MNSKTKKYIFTGETRITCGDVLHRIKAIRDFSDVKVGDLGGWVSKDDNIARTSLGCELVKANLSHEGDCWVYDNACLFREARVSENAKVREHASVAGRAQVSGNAQVSGHSVINNDAQVYNDACICDDASVFNSACVFGNAKILNKACVFNHAKVYGNAVVCNEAQIRSNAIVSDNAKISENARISGGARIYGNTEVRGKAKVFASATIFCNTTISNTSDYLTCGPIGSQNIMLTAYKANNGINIAFGSFIGTLEQFTQEVNTVCKDSELQEAYLLYCDVIKLHFGIK